MARRRHGYYSHWCSLLDFHLKRKRLSVTAFAKLVGRSQQIVHAYLVGRARPPLAELDKWADSLGLTGQEREQFAMAAYEAWTPEPVWARLAKLETVARQAGLPTDTATLALRRCQAVVAELVALLEELEALFYTRTVPVDKLRPMRDRLGPMIRRAIEQYARPT